MSMASTSPQVRQILKTLQARIRQRLAEDDAIVQTLQDSRMGPATGIPLTCGHLSAIKAAEDAIAADERFEYLAPAEDLIREFAADCVSDRQSDHVKPFMERCGRDASERVCYFGLESLRVTQPAEVAHVRLLRPDDPEI